MPSNLKNMVRTRMEKTGESYQQALRHVRGGGGPRLEAVIRGLIPLAEARLRESEALRTPLGLTIPEDDATAAYFRKPRPAEDALQAALKKLDLPMLRKIEAVMYAGREDDDVLMTHRHLHKDDQPITAHVIASKLPLAEYLADGLRLVREQGVDLDGAW